MNAIMQATGWGTQVVDANDYFVIDSDKIWTKVVQTVPKRWQKLMSMSVEISSKYILHNKTKFWLNLLDHSKRQPLGWNQINLIITVNIQLHFQKFYKGLSSMW